MTNFEQLVEIKKQYVDKSWFESIDVKDDKIIIYVNKMDNEVFTSVPDKIFDKNVKIHYQSSKTCSTNMYLKTYNYEDFETNYRLFKFVDENTKIYGKTVMANMFYEVHDGKDAVTNIKIKYPHLHTEMENYYKEYGYSSLVRELRPYGIVY